MADSDTNSEVQRERKRDIAARLLYVTTLYLFSHT